MADSRKLARFFKSLSVDTRVRIIQLLKGRALCVGALSARLDVTQGAVSQHLRVLRDAELVLAERRGYYIHYRLNGKTLAKWKNTMEGLLETDAPKGSSPCAISGKRKEIRHVRRNKGMSKARRAGRRARGMHAAADHEVSRRR